MKAVLLSIIYKVDRHTWSALGNYIVVLAHVARIQSIGASRDVVDIVDPVETYRRIADWGAFCKNALVV